MVAFSNTKSKQSADLAVKTWKMKYFQSFFESKPWLLFKIARTFNHWFGLKPELCQGKYKATRAVRPNCDPHNAETDRWINRRTVQSSRPTGQLIGRKKTEGFGASACPTIDSTDAYFKAFLTRLNTLTAENYWRCTQMGGGSFHKNYMFVCVTSCDRTKRSDESCSNHPTEYTSSGNSSLNTSQSGHRVCAEAWIWGQQRFLCVSEEAGLDWHVFTIIILPKWCCRDSSESHCTCPVALRPQRCIN